MYVHKSVMYVGISTYFRHQILPQTCLKCRGLHCVTGQHPPGLRNKPRHDVPFPGFDKCIPDYVQTTSANPYASVVVTYNIKLQSME